MIQVLLYSKPECHLCEEVKAQLARLRERVPFELREINILEDAESFARFQNEIPVVFVNGRKAFKYRLDEEEFLRRAQSILKQERNQRGA